MQTSRKPYEITAKIPQYITIVFFPDSKVKKKNVRQSNTEKKRRGKNKRMRAIKSKHTVVAVPSWSANCFPLSADTTRSSSKSHLLPTSTTWALSHEYVLICVHLQAVTNTHTAARSVRGGGRREGGREGGRQKKKPFKEKRSLVWPVKKKRC